MGNRLTQDANGTRTTYGYDSANRLTSVNGQAYTWDNNGNLTSDGLLTYSYDQANRLKQVTQGANTYTFAYNGLGDRLSQTVGITTTRYVLDPSAGLTQVLADGTNTYLYGNGRLAQYQANMQYFGADGLGSVRQLFDASGQVLADNRYDPYGTVLAQSGTATSVFGYTGEQYDASTGLEYLRARYYSSAQGRFFQQDPFAGRPESPTSLHKYLYGTNDPVRRTDPSGRDGPPGEDCLYGLWITDLETGELRYDCRIGSQTNLVGTGLKSSVPLLPSDDRDNQYNLLTGRTESMTGFIWQNYFAPPLQSYNNFTFAWTDTAIGFIPGGNEAYNWLLSWFGRNPFTLQTLSDQEKKSRAIAGAMGFAGDLGCFFLPMAGGIKPVASDVQKMAADATHLGTSKIFVIGEFSPRSGPNYIAAAENLHASYFSMDNALWNFLDYATRLEVNKEALRQAVARGETIRLGTSLNPVVGETLREEITFLYNEFGLALKGNVFVK